MSRSSLLALFLSLIAGLAAFWVGERVFENMAHLEDEMAYVWQARVLAAGQVWIESPPMGKDFLVPFVVDHEGRRFGKYPLGWPVMLALGVKAGVRALVNPLLAALAVWLSFRLGQKLRGDAVGLVAALLTATSPFFLLNAGSLLSHVWGLVLSTAFVLAWWDAFGERGTPGGWLPTLTAGATLGVFALSRPFTAVGVALPFGVHGLYVLWRGPAAARRRVLAIGALAAAIGSLHFLWQYAVTGDPWLNPYLLWWPYDTVGFGPGVGRYGHTLHLAWINTGFSLYVGAADLFGWGRLSWVFLPVGVWAARREGRVLLTGSVFFSLLVLYLAYWVGAWLYGPRYEFEGLYSLTLLSAAGLAWLAGWAPASGSGVEGTRNRWGRARSLGVVFGLGMLVSVNLIFYLPLRLESMQGLYGITRSRLAPFESAEAHALTPAVVVVEAEKWTEYGALLELEDPFLRSPFIFTFGSVPREDLERNFPGRKVFYYYPEEPYRLYTGEK